MISFKLDEIAGVLTVRPEGKLEAQDFQTLSQAVDPYIEEKGKLTGLIIATEKFPGWKDFYGLIEHLKFARVHHRDIARVALVTDSKFADVAQTLGKYFIKASINYFSFKELESAKSWMSQAP